MRDILAIAILHLVLIVKAISGRQPTDDLVNPVPSFPAGAPRIFSGILPTKTGSNISYLLVQSKIDNNNLPLTVWFNGAPGCSSKTGFLQQIGPYILPPNTPYNDSNNFTQNPYSWHTLSNLLFLDTPLGVGYTLPGNESYAYNDHNAAQENLNALIVFMSKFQAFQTKLVFLAGQSYAGKFIPDLALRIQSYNINASPKIKLQGILVGNGVMDLSDNRLQKSQINYLFSRNFIDPTLQRYWQSSCQYDPQSAGCQFFFRRYQDILTQVNFHNIYGKCSNSTSLFNKQNKFKRTLTGFFNRKTQFYNMHKKCQYYKGIQNYFQRYKVEFHGQKQNFVVCNETIYQNYEETPSGSVNEYARLISQLNIRIYLYAGDWDDIVPYPYIISNLERLGLRQNGPVSFWVNTKTNQHIGFKRLYIQGTKEVKFWLIKGAGHEVPMYKRQAAFQMFSDFISAAS